MAVVITYGVIPAFSSTIVYGPPVQTSIKVDIQKNDANATYDHGSKRYIVI